MESLVKKQELIEVLNKRGLRFTWNSPLEGMGRTYKLDDVRKERGMAWMLRAACKRQEAVHAVANCRRAPVIPNPDDNEEEDSIVHRPLVVVGGSVLGTPTTGVGAGAGAGGAIGPSPAGTPTPGRTPKSPGPVLGESAPAVATTLRQAAGLYKHSAENVLPELKDSLPGERPNELLASMAHTMRLICLAEAQAASARRAEEKGTAHGLLCKLHMGVHDLYKEADKMLGDHVSDFNFIGKKLQAYILLGITTHRARAHRAAAEEAAAANDIGEAIASCDAAAKHLARSVGAAGETEAWRAAAGEEAEALAAIRAKFVRENEVVFFEKVPEKPAKNLPEGKVIVAEIEHVPCEQLQNLFVE